MTWPWKNEPQTFLEEVGLPVLCAALAAVTGWSLLISLPGLDLATPPPWGLYLWLGMASIMGTVLGRLGLKERVPTTFWMLMALGVFVVTRGVLVWSAGGWEAFWARPWVFDPTRGVWQFVAISVWWWGLSSGWDLARVRAHWAEEDLPPPISNPLYDAWLSSPHTRGQAFTSEAISSLQRRTLFLGLLQVIVVGVLTESDQSLSLPLKALGWCFFALSLVFLALMQQLRLAKNWRGLGLTPPQQWGQNSLRYLAIFLLVLILFLGLLPENYSPLSTTTLRHGFESLVGVMHPSYQRLRQELEQDPLTIEPWEMETEETEMALWLQVGAIIYLFFQILVFILFPSLVILGLIGWLLVRFFLSEYEQLQGVTALFVSLYLWWTGLFQSVRGFGKEIKVFMKTQRQGSISSVQMGDRRGRMRLRGRVMTGVRAQFYRLLWGAYRLGLGRRRSETAWEFSQRLGEVLPEDEGELLELTDAYNQSRYSQEGADYPRAKNLVARIVSRLKKEMKG